MKPIRQVASCEDLLQRTRICFLAEVGAALALLEAGQQHHETVVAVLREVKFVRNSQRPSDRPHSFDWPFGTVGLALPPSKTKRFSCSLDESDNPSRFVQEMAFALSKL